MEHIEGCFQLEKEPCISLMSLHGEKIGEHWWSGWPSAYCLKCLEEDKDELCIGNACACPCHKEFWEAYDRAEQTPPTTASDMSDSDYRADWDLII